MNADRLYELKTAVLSELVHTPRSYMLPEKELRSGVNLSTPTPPTDAEWEEIVLLLEQRERLIAREESEARRTSLWYVTPLGRRHATEMGID